MGASVCRVARCHHTRSWVHRKTIDRKRLTPDSLKCRVPMALPMDSFWAVFFFCQDVTDHFTLAGSAESPLFVCRDHSAPPLLGSKHGMGSVGFRWSYADNSGCLTRGANNTNVHVALLSAGSRCSRPFPCQRKYTCFGFEACCNGTGKRISRMLSRSDCLFSSYW